MSNKNITNLIRIFIKIGLVVLIVLWVYGLFADYSDVTVKPVQDNCTMNSQVNNCIVLGTEK